MPDQRPPAIFLMGPTASGKTALALALTELWPMEIISVDSALVFRSMDIGSGKPDAATLDAAPHRLINLRDPTEIYSAADFCTDAMLAMREISGRGRIPLLVGGSSMYFRALQHGLSDLPAADSALRRLLEAEAAALGWQAMHERLQTLDPLAAARIHRNDPQRIQRALEVIALSGQALSAQQNRQRRVLPCRVLKIALNPPQREVLHQRIEERFDHMLAAGLIEEVRQLKAMPGMHADLPSMRSVGYRQVWEFLDGTVSAEQMRLNGIYATRQLAKRQITWLRAEADAFWRDPTSADALATVVTLVSGFVAAPMK